jgi:hypothetical protein
VFDEDAQEESSWTTPLRIFFITVVLAGGYLYYYLGPSVDDIQGNTPKASVSTVPIELIVGGTTFSIPENFTQFPRARRGGVRDNVALYAMLPNLGPFTHDDAEYFEDSTKTSPIVHFQIESYRAPFNEEERFSRIYRPKIADLEGSKGPDGLTAYTFREGSGYQDEDLFVGKDDLGNMVLLRCTRVESKLLYPNCRRDSQMTDTVGLSYRFKRSRLDSWREIDNDVRALAISFQVATP